MPSDLRDELKARIERIQKEINQFQTERQKLENQIAEKESTLKVWSNALKIEIEQWGEPNLPLFNKENHPYRFVGLKLIDAVGMLRKEQPGITKEKVREILERNNFDFRGKRPGTAVHMVWVFLDRRSKNISA
jgi:hypothetical protein